MAIDRRSVVVALVLAAFAVTLGCGGVEVVRSHYTQAVEYYDEGRPIDAIAAYELALDDRPDDYRVHYNLALACHDVFVEAKDDGDSARARRYHDRALRHYDRVLALDDGNPRAIASKAALLSDAGNALGALAFLENTQADGENGTSLVHWARGNLLVDQGNEPEAMRSYRVALYHNEAFLPAISALGELLITRGRNDEAEELLTDAVKMVPSDLTLRLQHGDVAAARARAATGDARTKAWRQARARYRTASGLAPRSWRAAYGYAEASQGLGDVEEAVRAYWDARDLATDGGLRRAGFDPAAWRRDLSSRLRSLYPRLAGS